MIETYGNVVSVQYLHMQIYELQYIQWRIILRFAMIFSLLIRYVFIIASETSKIVKSVFEDS